MSVGGYLCNVVDKSVQVSKQKNHTPSKTEEHKSSRQSASATSSPHGCPTKSFKNSSKSEALLSQGDDCVAQHIRQKLLKAMPHDCMPNATILPDTLWQRLQSLHINRQRDVSSASTTTLARVLHVMKCGDYDESGGGREDDFDAGCDDERACSYIGDTKYVALTGRRRT